MRKQRSQETDGSTGTYASAHKVRTKTRKPTLKTIAQMSGLAVPTVSRALSDAPDISEDTKVLVRNLAKEVGYVRNRAGLNLRTGRTNVISLILSSEKDLMTQTAQLMSSIALGLQGTPFHLSITPSFPDQDLLEPVRAIVESGSADAIIMNQTLSRDPRVEYLASENFPFVTHGRTEWGFEHPYFDYDNEAFGHVAVKKLFRCGCRNLLFIAPPQDQTYARALIKGIGDEAAQSGLSVFVEDTVSTADPAEEIQHCIEKRLRENPAIDGYIAVTVMAVLAAIGGIEAAGRKLGEDFFLVSKERDQLVSLFQKGIIALPENVALAGEFLVHAAIQALLHPEKPPCQKLEIPQDDGQ